MIFFVAASLPKNQLFDLKWPLGVYKSNFTGTLVIEILGMLAAEASL